MLEKVTRMASTQRWRAAIVRGVDLVPCEAEVRATMTFLSRDDGQASGEVAEMPMEELAAVMDRLGAKKASEMPGRPCMILVESDGKTVARVDHLFSQNPVEG